MDNKPEVFVKAFLPSVLDVFFLVIILFIFVFDAGAHLLKDADTGFHIMTGRYFIDNLAPPPGDIFSYTVPGQQWMAFSWGTGVVFAMAERLAGLNGVVFISTALILSTMYIIYKLLMRWNVSFLVLFVSISALICMNTVHWLARPHLFTIFFTALSFYILESAKDNKKLYYLLLPVMLVWANCHPGFISGGFIIFLYFTGNIIEWLLNKNNGEGVLYFERFKTLFFVGVACFILTLINPYGINLYIYIYKTLTSSWIVNACLEYHSPTFHNTLSVFVYEFVILSIIVLGFLKSKKVLDAPKILLLLLWAHLSLFAIRNIAIFAVVSVPCLALLLQAFFDSRDWAYLKKLDSNMLKTEKSLSFPGLPIIVMIVFALVAINNGYLFEKKLLKCDFSPERIPVAAMNYIEQNPIKGNMLNSDNWGGYIIYKYPDIKVFMDGRLDMYQQEFLGKYQLVAKVKEGWESILDEYNVEWILFNRNTLLNNLLTQHPGWEIYYSDNLCTIFKRKQEVNN